MRSIGARLAMWYALVTLATMVGVFTAGRYLLEKYVVHSLDLINEDEFSQIQDRLGPGYAGLTPAQIQDRLREAAGAKSVLFYIDIHRRTGETLFLSHNLAGHPIPDVPGERSVGLIERDWPVFVAAGETTRYVGDVLAAVAAETRHQARAAAALVRKPAGTGGVQRNAGQGE